MLYTCNCAHLTTRIDDVIHEFIDFQFYADLCLVSWVVWNLCVVDLQLETVVDELDSTISVAVVDDRCLVDDPHVDVFVLAVCLKHSNFP